VSATTGALEIDGLSVGYGDVRVLHDLHLHAAPGEVVALLGPNGAGKTTALLAVSGLLPIQAGQIRFAGRPLGARRRVRPAAVAAQARRGVAHVPEDRALFVDLTVAEHLRLGRPRRRPGAGLTDAEVYTRFPALEPLGDRRAGLLSGGEQQMLALARALVSRPRLLLVDELSLGLAPMVVQGLLPALRQVADDTGAAVLVVEQHVTLALQISDRAYLLDRGRVMASGSATELAARVDLLEAGYLGGDRPA